MAIRRNASALRRGRWWKLALALVALGCKSVPLGAGGEGEGPAGAGRYTSDPTAWGAVAPGAGAMPDVGSGGVADQPEAGKGFFGSSFVPESHGAGGSGGSGSSSAESEFCGDGIRDVLIEECDSGPEDGVSCSAQCQVQDFLLVEPPESPVSVPSTGRRVLGLGRHPSAALPETLAVAFIELF